MLRNQINAVGARLFNGSITPNVAAEQARTIWGAAAEKKMQARGMTVTSIRVPTPLTHDGHVQVEAVDAQGRTQDIIMGKRSLQA